MTKNEYQTRITELIARGYSERAATRTAKRERRIASPAHKAAIARHHEAAQARAEYLAGKETK